MWPSLSSTHICKFLQSQWTAINFSWTLGSLPHLSQSPAPACTSTEDKGTVSRSEARTETPGLPAPAGHSWRSSQTPIRAGLGAPGLQAEAPHPWVAGSAPGEQTLHWGGPRMSDVPWRKSLLHSNQKTRHFSTTEKKQHKEEQLMENLQSQVTEKEQRKL